MKKADIISLYTTTTSTVVDYTKMSKDELIQVIKDLESKIPATDNIGNLIVKMLLDDNLATATNIDIAEAIRELVPGCETSAKSVSSVRSVYNRDVIAKATAALPSSLTPRERAIAETEIKFDLIEKGLLIRPRA